MSRGLRLLVSAVAAAGTGAIAVSVWANPPLPAPAPWKLLAGVGIAAMADVALVQIRIGHNRQAFTWSEAFVILGFVLVPQPWLVLLAPPVVTATGLLTRKPLVKAAFNGFGMAAGVALGRGVYGVLAGSGPVRFDSVGPWLGLACAALALSLWSHTTVAGAVALSQGTSFSGVFTRTLPLSAVVWVGNTAAGLGLVAVSIYDHRTLFVLPVLLGVVLVGYRAYLHARQDASTWQLLQRASRELTQLRQDDLVQAVTASAEALFDAEFVECLVVGPGGRARVHRRSRGEATLFVSDPVSAAPSFWPRASSERQPFHTDLRSARGVQRAELDRLGLAYCAVVPLVVSEDCLGMLRVGFRGPVRMSARELQVLETFANQTATSVCNAQLFERTTALFEQNRAITENLGEGVVAVDAEGRITFANPAAGVMAARPVPELLGVRVHDALHGALRGAYRDHGPDEPCLLLGALTGGTVRADNHVIGRPDGTKLSVAVTGSSILHGDQVVGAVLAMRDVTERRALEAQLAYQAFHDPITDIANRALFLDRLQHSLSRRRNSPPAVLFVDLDRFKVVNDSLGHRAGDVLLRQVAERLSHCLRPADTLARWGGDEFTVLLEDFSEMREPSVVAERILAAMARPFAVDDHDVVLSVSVGVAVSQPGVNEPQQLIHAADVAMYQAKGRGRDTYALFRPEMRDAPLARLEMETSMRRGLDNHEFQVHYQPIVSTHTGRLRGVEALVRWNSPRGLQSPGSFIALAEDTGMILPLGRQVLEEACRQVRRWQDDHIAAAALELSVNLSARQFQDPGLAADVEAILRSSGLAPGLLCLEITESVVMQDVPSTMTTLADLKNLGVRLAIDDFGTGYSSLSYLKRFPVDAVKIDRSFVEGLGDHPVDTEIVAAVVRLARSLGMRAVAEGVETSTQLDILRDIGCPLVQGWYYSAARPAEHIEALIEDQLLRAR